jgi:hypothetical protein
MKKAVWRLVVFLRVLHIDPVFEGFCYADYHRALLRQYMAIPQDVRSEARRQGRRQIRESGLRTLASAIVPVPLPLFYRSVSKNQVPAKANGLPRSCWSRSGKPKRVWTNREDAKAFCLMMKDQKLNVYECQGSCGKGTGDSRVFHIGHLQRTPIGQRSLPARDVQPVIPDFFGDAI